MDGRWVKKRRWPVSHFLRDDDHRPRHLGNEEGRGACGVFITVTDGLEAEPVGGMDTCGRCVGCRRRLAAHGIDTEE